MRRFASRLVRCGVHGAVLRELPRGFSSPHLCLHAPQCALSSAPAAKTRTLVRRVDFRAWAACACVTRRSRQPNSYSRWLSSRLAVCTVRVRFCSTACVQHSLDVVRAAVARVRFAFPDVDLRFRSSFSFFVFVFKTAHSCACFTLTLFSSAKKR